MSHPHAPGRDSPSRWQALVFHTKTRVFQVRRGIVEFKTRPPLHLSDIELTSPDSAALKAAIRAVLDPCADS